MEKALLRRDYMIMMAPAVHCLVRLGGEGEREREKVDEIVREKEIEREKERERGNEREFAREERRGVSSPPLRGEREIVREIDLLIETCSGVEEGSSSAASQTGWS